jgi:hypothetical protein
MSSLSSAEFGVLVWLIAEKLRWFPEGRFIEDGKVFSLRMLAERSPYRGGGALGCLHGLQSAGFLSRESDGVFRLVEKWRQDEAGEGCDEPVLSKVHAASPLSPITPIPRENTKRETLPPPVEAVRSLPAELIKVPGLPQAWSDWVRHIRELRRLSNVKLDQDIHSLKTMLSSLGPEKTVLRLKECIAQGFSAIGLPKSFPKPSAYTQHSPTRPDGPGEGKLTKENFLPKYE